MLYISTILSNMQQEGLSIDGTLMFCKPNYDTSDYNQRLNVILSHPIIIEDLFWAQLTSGFKSFIKIKGILTSFNKGRLLTNDNVKVLPSYCSPHHESYHSRLAHAIRVGKNITDNIKKGKSYFCKHNIIIQEQILLDKLDQFTIVNGVKLVF